MVLLTVTLLVIIIAQLTYLILKLGLSPAKGASRGGVFIDTSALMDGRIVTAAETGFIPGRLIVPASVVHELQLLADQADSERRSRARRGLDAIQQLQGVEITTVTVLNDGKVGSGGVDERLIELARKYKGSICTIDFNLNKAATAHGITILNVNELAGSIRMAFLPGETITLTLTQKGQGNGQAVGYLADGTMVVVDKAADSIGKPIQIEFIRSLQTAAGRMMFARPTSKKASAKTRGEVESDVHALEKPAKQNTQNVKQQMTRDASKPDASRKSPNGRKAIVANSRIRRPTSRDKEDSLIELVNNQ